MGKHNQYKRKEYMKRRKARIRETNLTVNSTIKTSESGDHTPSCSSSSLFPTSSAAASLQSSSNNLNGYKSLSHSTRPITRGQLCINAVKSVASASEITSTEAAIKRGEIPNKVLNDVLVRKWEEYKLLYKQLYLIKQRLNLVEFGDEKGRLLNQLKVDIKR